MKPLSSPNPIFLPKLWTTLKGYSLAQFTSDATAGVIVGIVALPLAIAFAIASGVTPDKGLITAIVAGLLISGLGGSRVQIGGPTGAFVVIVFGIVGKYGVDGLTVCTLMAGAILIAMGLSRMGSVIRFIPYPLTVGFTSGIAFVIFSQQVKDLLGLTTPPMPGDVIGRWIIYARCLSTANLAAIGTATGSLAIMIVWPKVSRRLPGSIIALIAATTAAWYFHLPVETIGTRFGELAHKLPPPVLPSISFSRCRELVGPAFTVALLGAIESLLSATVADSMVGGYHRSNTELIAQGLANMASALFGGIPATGAIARTATNVKNGGRTPIAGMVHSITLLLLMMVLAPLAKLIPLCALAAILVIVCYHMSEWRAFRALLSAPKSDIAVLLTTFFLTVFVDLTVAVSVGVILAMALFIRRMTSVSAIRDISKHVEDATDRLTGELPQAKLPEGVAMYEAEGALFFGVAAQLRETFALGAAPPKVLILIMRSVLSLDASGIRALEDLRRVCHASGGRLILVGLRPQPQKALHAAKPLAAFTPSDICSDVPRALAHVSA